MNNFNRKEMLIIIFAVFIFIILSSIVIFKREWLDSLFFGPIPYEAVDVDEETFDLETEETVLEIPSVSLNIVSDVEKADVVFTLEESLKLTGFELVFSKSSSLEVSDFVCSLPFECIFLETEDQKLSVSAFIPVTSVESLDVGDVVVGSFNFSRDGTLTLIPGESMILDVENLEYNLLDVSVLEFEL
jgi:hypothetical protein